MLHCERKQIKPQRSFLVSPAQRFRITCTRDPSLLLTGPGLKMPVSTAQPLVLVKLGVVCKVAGRGLRTDGGRVSDSLSPSLNPFSPPLLFPHASPESLT